MEQEAQAGSKVTSSQTPLQQSPMNQKVLFALIIVVLLGVGTGMVGSFLTRGSGSSFKKMSRTTTTTEEGQAIYGSEDETTFKDSAEGILRPGGIEGEGAFHLEREGGKSQNVYLISSVVDLSMFEGKKVKVWGETFQGKKAGWLMDAGRLQVLE